MSCPHIFLNSAALGWHISEEILMRIVIHGQDEHKDLRLPLQDTLLFHVDLRRIRRLSPPLQLT